MVEAVFIQFLHLTAAYFLVFQEEPGMAAFELQTTNANRVNQIDRCYSLRRPFLFLHDVFALKIGFTLAITV